MSNLIVEYVVEYVRVLRILKHTDIVTSDKRLAAYVERCTARPAFKRAFDAQTGDFRKAA